MYFDGSDVGVTGEIDALVVRPDGSILFSLAAPATLVGVGAVDDSDIVEFIPTSTGSNTAGTFESYFDGSDVGLDVDAEDVDAIAFTTDAKLVISTTGPFAVPGASGADEDLLTFDATCLEGDLPARVIPVAPGLCISMAPMWL
jgi:hypothetical protein